MVSRDEDKYVIWPLYFEKNCSRSNGRKISKKYSIDKPTIDNIEKAAKSLNLHPILEKDYSHPSRPWRKEGRILIDKKDTKSKILLQISKLL